MKIYLLSGLHIENKNDQYDVLEPAINLSARMLKQGTRHGAWEIGFKCKRKPLNTGSGIP
jgi:hypothetical protein